MVSLVLLEEELSQYIYQMLTSASRYVHSLTRDTLVLSTK